MNFSEYKYLALRTEKPLATALLRLNHAHLGFFTEGGEFTTTVKRIAIYEKPCSAEFIKHMREELGDILWYAAIAADALELDIPQYQFLFDDFMQHPVPFALNLVATRLSVEIGFFGLDIPVHDVPRNRESMMRGVVNIVSAVAHACNALGFRIEDVMAENIAKLKDRFPNAYSNQAAEARADKGGLDARNS